MWSYDQKLTKTLVYHELVLGQTHTLHHWRHFFFSNTVSNKESKWTAKGTLFIFFFTAGTNHELGTARPISTSSERVENRNSTPVIFLVILSTLAAAMGIYAFAITYFYWKLRKSGNMAQKRNSKSDKIRLSLKEQEKGTTSTNRSDTPVMEPAAGSDNYEKVETEPPLQRGERTVQQEREDEGCTSSCRLQAADSPKSSLYEDLKPTPAQGHYAFPDPKSQACKPDPKPSDYASLSKDMSQHTYEPLVKPREARKWKTEL